MKRPPTTRERELDDVLKRWAIAIATSRTLIKPIHGFSSWPCARDTICDCGLTHIYSFTNHDGVVI